MPPSRSSFSSSSFECRRTLRTATRPSSARSWTCFTRSLRRSSVSGGNARRITWPSLEGVIPRSLDWIAFSIAPMAPLSKGWTASSRGSGTLTRGELVQRDRGPVVLDGHAVQRPAAESPDRSGSPARSSLQVRDRLLHLVVGVLEGGVDRHRAPSVDERADRLAVTTRADVPLLARSNTMIGSLFSMHSEMAVASITW